MTCTHYKGKGIKKHFKLDDKLKCKLCGKALSGADILKLKKIMGEA